MQDENREQQHSDANRHSHRGDGASAIDEPVENAFGHHARRHGQRAESEAQLKGLKGHKAMGGLRATFYNAQKDESVDALVEYMAEFVRTRG